MTPARVTVVGSEVLERLRTEQLRDAIDDAAPDLLLPTSTGARNRLRASPAVPDDVPIWSVQPGTSSSDGGPRTLRAGDVDVVLATSDADLAALPALVADGQCDPATETYVLSDRLSVSVRPTALETSLEGFEEYRAAIERGRDAIDDTADARGATAADADDTSDGNGVTVDALDDSITHVSTSLPADYYAQREGYTLRGAAADGDALDVAVGAGRDEPTLLTLALGPDGAIGSRQLGPEDLGLRSIRGVGRSRATTLREAGIWTVESLSDADLRELAEIDGLGRRVAHRLRAHALAEREGRVLQTGDGTLPSRDPVFVDVETDGLSPSIVWLVGVLDRTQDRYMSFLARDPDDPGQALAAFCSWYFANASGRPIVAYNGLSFDFPVIEEQVERHCPRHLADWRDAWTFDPYFWAVTEHNAVLPGRTNALEDVAAALGYESAALSYESAALDDEPSAAGHESATSPSAGTPSPLGGAEVARQYRRWNAERTPEAEPDWERLEAYCEDDVRALAHVYDAIDAADRRVNADGRAESADRRSTTTAERTTQGSLGDF